MLRAKLSNKSVSRVELDQRARDARLRLERIERLLVLRAAVTNSWLRRFSFGRYTGAQGRRTRRPLSNRRPSRPQIHQGWLEVCGSFCRALGLPLQDYSGGNPHP
jgi:hypothetical protein